MVSKYCEINNEITMMCLTNGNWKNSSIVKKLLNS